MGQIERADVAVAVPAEPHRVHGLLVEGPDGGRADEEAIHVEVLVAAVVEDVQVEHQGVPGPDEVLNEVVHDAEVLLARIEQPVQPAIRVFLERTEVGGVELMPIGAQVAEQAEAELVVAEDEAAKVAGERLNARAGRQEVVMGAEIAQVVLDEELLKTHVAVETRGALAHVDVHDAGFLRVQVVEVEHRGDPELPVPRLECGVALEELQRQDEILIEKDLVARPEELGLTAIGRADVAGKRDPTQLEQTVADGRDVQEVALPDDRVVALQHVLVVGVPPASLDIRRLQRALVAVPVGESQSPAVQDRHEVGAGPRRARAGRRGPGEPGRLVLGLDRGRPRRLHRGLLRLLGFGSPGALRQQDGRPQGGDGFGDRWFTGDSGRKRGQHQSD